MGALILGGTVYGLTTNDKSLVLADANAWYYFFIAPIVYDALSKKDALIRAAHLVCVAIAAQLAKTFFLIYAMSHPAMGYEIMIALYRWVRDTGVGEVTMVSQNVYRTFLQSQIYLLPLFLGIFAYLRWGAGGKPLYASRYTGRAVWAGAFVCAGIIVSLSRSFWVALVIAGILMLIGAARAIRFKEYASWIGKCVLTVLLSLIIIIAVIRFPFPATTADLGLNSVSGRFENEAAVGSRWSLLPVMGGEIIKNPIIGYGFGKTLTYTTQDPRILEQNPSGEYTTYAFEWGYLEILLKVGVLGLAIYLSFLGYIVYIGWRAIHVMQRENNGMAYSWMVGLWLGLVCIMITHFFTPYLNHPLGIAYIVVVGLVFERMYPRAKSSPDMAAFPSG
ncbi:MAG: O-antigen ligase family protein [Patescibacteria group bacterium]